VLYLAKKVKIEANMVRHYLAPKGIAFLCWVALCGHASFLAAQSTNGILWEIQKPNAKNTSYLMGTIHVGNPAAFQFPDAFWASFQKAPNLYLEITEGNVDPLTMVNKLSLPKGVILDSLYKPKELARLDSFVRAELDPENGLNLYQPFKPILIWLSFLRKGVEGPKEDSAGLPTLDFYLKNTALQMGRKVAGLETPAKQMEALFSIDLKVQRDLTLYLIDHANPQEEERAMQKMIQTYVAGNLDSLTHLVLDANLPLEMRRNLLDKRNVNMTNRMDSLIRVDTASYFFAVGAGHLGGPMGILKLLQSKGYQVRPLPRDARALENWRKAEAWQASSCDDGKFKLAMPLRPLTFVNVFGSRRGTFAGRRCSILLADLPSVGVRIEAVHTLLNEKEVAKPMASVREYLGRVMDLQQLVARPRGEDLVAQGIAVTEGQSSRYWFVLQHGNSIVELNFTSQVWAQDVERLAKYYFDSLTFPTQ
jgi:uncharacterized protein